ncbi:MAG: TetR/AcrR family transcriptional regulator [Anaerolineales bacterium]|nr:TetR/AcrR family transcriptional regulator [Anaerolineales bacterium]
MHDKVTVDGRERILNVAEELFMEGGYRAVSIRDIAQACDVTNAALYYHFPNKAALFREVIERYAQHFQDQLREAIDMGGSTREQAGGVLKRFAVLMSAREAPIFSGRRELKELQDPQEAQRIYHSILEPLDDVLRKAIERGELKAMPEEYSPAALLFGIMHGLTMHSKFRGQHKEMTSEQLDEIVDLAIQVFWDGLEQKENGSSQEG